MNESVSTARRRHLPPLIGTVTGLAMVLLHLPGCPEGPSGVHQCADDDVYHYLARLDHAEGCGLSVTQCNACPADSVCMGQLVSGTYRDGGRATWGAQLGTCAVPCSSGTDCAQISFASANGVQTDSEAWGCGSDGFCTGRIAYEPPNLSACQQCQATCAGEGSWCSCASEC